MSEISSVYMGGSKAIGDTVWHAFVLTSLHDLFPDARISIPTEGVASQVIDPSLASTSLAIVPNGNNRKLEGQEITILPEEWDFLEPGNSTKYDIRLPTVKMYRTQGIDSFEESPHYAATGEGHVIDAYLERIREAFPALPPARLPQMPNLEAERIKMARYIDPEKPTVTINTGTSMVGKNYPIEKWLDVADELVATGNRVILIGGKGDPTPPLLWRVRRPIIEVLIGKLTLRESMALIALSDLHLSGDTGTGHIAAAYGIDTLTLFGTLSFPEIGRPYGDRAVVIQSDTLSPAGISVSSVVEGALNILEK